MFRPQNSQSTVIQRVVNCVKITNEVNGEPIGFFLISKIIELQHCYLNRMDLTSKPTFERRSSNPETKR